MVPVNAKFVLVTQICKVLGITACTRRAPANCVENVDRYKRSDSNIACLCQSIEIDNNKRVYHQSQVRKPTASEVDWAECLLIIGTGCRVEVLAWSSIAQSVCQQAFSLLANRCLRPWVRILHSAEEDNLSPFDSNIACLCQSIEINNNKYII